ncbi:MULTISPECIES: PAS domain S-box protein [unclassified Coleofasciculus]|uniref:PAS domain S-box protein n=1 Tax=unclassified Coleofasciculus TaxID=2692782 RepID=UPI001880D8B8|nr:MULTISPECIES: PAS domain S-box protein [unclassified Coleofasciculus]MBE9125965.1 PAS domain S-box protein [Coleofasciculus sp. LEGE 07081]MBE9148839.1 PAS domain S-box protein [Coleofasciculus sp. LEGE 07092]
MNGSIEQKITVGGLGLALLILSGAIAFSCWTIIAVPSALTHLPNPMLVVAIANGFSLGLLTGVYCQLRQLFTDSLPVQDAWQKLEDNSCDIKVARALSCETQLSLDQELERQLAERTAQFQAEIAQLRQVEAEKTALIRSLQESEERFRVVLKNSPIVVFNQDRELRYTWVYNPASGIDGSTLVGKLETELFEPENAERLIAVKHRVLTSGIGERQEIAIAVDGQIRYYDLTVEPLFDSDRNVVGITCAAMNISQRKQAEQELQYREALLSKILDTLPVGVWITNEVGVILQSNPAGEQIWAGARYVGVNQYGEYKGWWTNTGEPIAPDKWALSRAITKGETSINEVIKIQCFDGTYKTILNSAMPLWNEDQAIIGAIVVNQDITELKQVEETLRKSQHFIQQITDTTPNLLYIYDQIQHRIIWVNRRSEEFFGMTQAQIQAKSFPFIPEVLHPADSPYRALIQEQYLTANEGEIFEQEVRVKNAQGEWCWLHLWEIVFTQNDEGMPEYILGTAINVTERKQLEAELAASEERFRTSIENMLDCFSICTSIRDESGKIADFCIEYVNRAACEDTGLTKAEQIGKRLCKLFPANRENGLFDDYCQVVETGQPFIKELVWYAEDTSPHRHLSQAYRISVVKFGDGYAVAWRDIIERKQAEEQQRKTQELYRTLTQNFPNGTVALFDKELRYTLVDGTGLAEVGLSNACLVGKTIGEAFPTKVYAEIEPYYHAVLKGEARVFEFALGERIYWVHLLPLKNEEGEVYGGLSMSQNISDRKRTELALLEERNFVSTILDTANALIVVFDQQGKIVHFNQACEKLTGYSADEVKGKFVWDFLLIDEEIELFKSEFRELQTTHTSKDFENSWIARDGSQNFFSWAHTVIFHANGSVKYIIGIGLDITERKRAEEIRRQLEREQELSHLRLRFFSLASHEFRTPLSTILASAQLLQLCARESSDQKRLRNLNRIEATAKRMRQMLEDILTINRAETGKLEFNPASLALEPFCQQIVEEMQLNAGNQYILTFNYQGDCKRAFFDEKLLRSILTNLLSNAIKYSTQGDEIQFQLICTPTEAIFQISDLGRGIPPSDQDHLFEAFHRGGNIGSIPGSGLGLTVAKNCVDVHGGTITVTSEVGVGTSFTVTIPFG